MVKKTGHLLLGEEKGGETKMLENGRGGDGNWVKKGWELGEKRGWELGEKGVGTWGEKGVGTWGVKGRNLEDRGWELGEKRVGT